MAETQVEKIMKHLNCSREEALDIIECDKAIDRGERMEFDLDPEKEKLAKKIGNVGTRKTNGKVERKRKENPTKATIVEEVYGMLVEKGYENVQITNKERQISFQSGENSFEITLVQKRKPKN
jgi:hypothetical protein